jgi:hypothetical protein
MNNNKYKEFLDSSKTKPIICFINNIETLWINKFKNNPTLHDYIQILKQLRIKESVEENIILNIDEFSEIFNRNNVIRIFQTFTEKEFLLKNFRYLIGENEESNLILKLLTFIQLFSLINPFGDIENEKDVKCCLDRLETFLPLNKFHEVELLDLILKGSCETNNKLNEKLKNNESQTDNDVNHVFMNNQIIDLEKEDEICDFFDDLDKGEEEDNILKVINFKLDILNYFFNVFIVKVLDNLTIKSDITRELVNIIECLFNFYNEKNAYFFNYFFKFCLKDGDFTFLKKTLHFLLDDKVLDYENIINLKENLKKIKFRDYNFKNENQYYNFLSTIYNNHFSNYLTLRKDFKCLKGVEDKNEKLIKLNTLITNFIVFINGLEKDLEFLQKKKYKCNINNNDIFKYKEKKISFLNCFLNICISKKANKALAQMKNRYKYDIDLHTINKTEIENLSKILKFEWVNLDSNYKKDLGTKNKFISKVNNNPKKIHKISSLTKKNQSLERIRRRTQQFTKLRFGTNNF